jgi:hypothetical protein
MVGRTDDDHVFVVNKRENHPASRYHQPISVFSAKRVNCLGVLGYKRIFEIESRETDRRGGRAGGRGAGRMIMTLF